MVHLESVRDWSLGDIDLGCILYNNSETFVDTKNCPKLGVGGRMLSPRPWPQGSAALESPFSTTGFDNSKANDSGRLWIRQQFGEAAEGEGENASPRPEIIRHTRKWQVGTGSGERTQDHMMKKEMTCVTQGRDRKGYLLHLFLFLPQWSESYQFQSG